MTTAPGVFGKEYRATCETDGGRRAFRTASRQLESSSSLATWKGRTARQDRPGQFYVILDQKAKPFNKKHDLAYKVKKLVIPKGQPDAGQPDHDARVELLEDCLRVDGARVDFGR